MSTAIIIPARFESTRFPGKPLAKISGKPMIEWVLASAKESKLANRVIVATEDVRIYDFVNRELHNEACLTSREHRSGTDRIAEVVNKFPEIKYVVNLQGDEPLMPAQYIDKVLEALLQINYSVDPSQNSVLFMSSLVAPLTTIEELNNPDIVKAVIDKNNFAMYFSRAAIPYERDKKSSTQSSTLNSGLFFRHIGIYAYTRDSLLQFSLLPQSSLEMTEQLEQLRALENGMIIRLDVVPKAFPAVDRPDDVKTVEDILRSLNS